MNRLLRFLGITGFRRGFLGGSRPWFVVWVVVTLYRRISNAGGAGEKVVFREELRPGEALVIRHGERSDRA